jgi:hypothetical protein
MRIVLLPGEHFIGVTVLNGDAVEAPGRTPRIATPVERQVPRASDVAAEKGRGRPGNAGPPGENRPHHSTTRSQRSRAACAPAVRSSYRRATPTGGRWKSRGVGDALTLKNSARDDEPAVPNGFRARVEYAPVSSEAMFTAAECAPPPTAGTGYPMDNSIFPVPCEGAVKPRGPMRVDDR